MELKGDVYYRIEESRRQESRLNCVHATVVLPFYRLGVTVVSETDYCEKMENLH